MPYYVYILSSRSRNLYTGVTNNLARRVSEHRQGLIPGFTHRYRIHRLVYFEPFVDVRAAISREKQIKKWRRAGAAIRGLKLGDPRPPIKPLATAARTRLGKLMVRLDKVM